MKEREIAQALAEREGGRCEVKTPVGRIDVLTSKYVYEVKGATEWKDAMGQVLAYQSYYPNHKPRLYLYGKPAITKKLIEEQCKARGIGVIWHRDEVGHPRTSKSVNPPQDLFQIELHMQQMKAFANGVFPIKVRRTYYLEIPPEPRTASELQTYLEELRGILDPLLDNQITLKLSYRVRGTEISLESFRENRAGTGVETGLVLFGTCEGPRPATRDSPARGSDAHSSITDLEAAQGRPHHLVRLDYPTRTRPIKLRFPGLREDLIQTQSMLRRRFNGCLYQNAYTLVRPLIKLVLRPGWRWKSSAKGTRIEHVTNIYPWSYRLVPSAKRDHYILKI
jgi:hypothetical protein